MLCLQLTELCFQQLALLALLELGMTLGLLGALAALCVLLLPRQWWPCLVRQAGDWGPNPGRPPPTSTGAAQVLFAIAPLCPALANGAPLTGHANDGGGCTGTNDVAVLVNQLP